jgi:hypothetical protein
MRPSGRLAPPRRGHLKRHTEMACIHVKKEKRRRRCPALYLRSSRVDWSLYSNSDFEFPRPKLRTN